MYVFRGRDIYPDVDKLGMNVFSAESTDHRFPIVASDIRYKYAVLSDFSGFFNIST